MPKTPKPQIEQSMIKQDAIEKLQSLQSHDEGSNVHASGTPFSATSSMQSAMGKSHASFAKFTRCFR
jgi:hypothetical protein